MNPNETVLGIDLGTTNTCAAFVQDGRPMIIPSDRGHTIIPSVVGLSKRGEVIVGQPALDQLVTRPEDTIYGSKRLIGRKFNSMVVEKMRHFMTYSIIEGDDGEAAVMLGGKKVSLTQVSAHVLAAIKEVAQGQLEKEITRAVITVPAYYNDNQRQAVKEAGALAGLKVERIINEPTAAAIAYGFNKGFNQNILIYDLGGGTFDVSILHVHDNEFKVLATGGDTFLGGIDFDHRVTAYALDKFGKAAGKDIREEKVAMQRLAAAAERAKRNLSNEEVTELHLPFITEIDGEPVDLLLKLTREQLNQLTSDLVDRTLRMCDDVLSSVGLAKSMIHEVLLVGGQTRMPLVQRKISEHFGKDPRKGVHPDEVVALGAALLGNPETARTKVSLRDVLSIPIGIALANGKFKVILDRNTPIPASKAYKLTMKKGMPLDIDIYQGENQRIFENEYLGTFHFPPPDQTTKGVQQLEMRFELSPECLLSVHARDITTGQESRAEMITMQTPKSMEQSVMAAMQSGGSREGWIASLANRLSKK